MIPGKSEILVKYPFPALSKHVAFRLASSLKPELPKHQQYLEASEFFGPPEAVFKTVRFALAFLVISISKSPW